MRRLAQPLADFICGEEGATAVEYALMMTCVVGAYYYVIRDWHIHTNNVFQTVAACLAVR